MKKESYFPVFNPKGNDIFRGLIWSKEAVQAATGLANLNDTENSYAVDWIKDAMSIIWRPEEISMIDDRKQFEMLSEDIKETFSIVIGLLIFFDSVVPNNTVNLLQVFAKEDIRTALFWHCAIEGLHRESYQYILKSIFGEDDLKIRNVYYKFKSYAPLEKRNEILARPFAELNDFLKFYGVKDLVEESKVSRLKAFLRKLLGYYSWDRKKVERLVFRALINDFAIEGIDFFMGFNVFHVFAFKMNILQGTNQNITQIRFDEELHVPLFKYIIQRWKEEGHYFNEQEAVDLIGEAVEADKEFYVNSISNIIPSMSEQNIKDYIETLANKRLELLGLPKIYSVNRNPFSDIERMLKRDKTQFFETGAVDYSHIPVAEENIDKAFE